MPLVTPLPTPPSSTDPTNFNTRADAFLGALPTLATEVNTVGTNMETQYNYVFANVSTTAASASQATTAANSAVSAKNSIEVLFLGSKTSNPTTNNSGGALVVGCKYFNTTVGEDRVWTGTNWVASTALGGTVASLTVDGELRLKTNTWHKDAAGVNRLYFGQGGSDATIVQGNQLVYWNNSSAEMFKVVNNGGMYAYGQTSLNAGGAFLSGHSVTVGSVNGGGNSVGFGVAPGGNGAWGTVGSDSTQTYIATNTYYAVGADRFSVAGYAPKIRFFTSNNTILFQQTDNGLVGSEQFAQNIANFDTNGAFIVNSRNGYGSAYLFGNSSSTTGFIGFTRPGGERTGYIGAANDTAGSNNLIVADNGHPWRFTGGSVAPQSDYDAVNGVDLTRLSQFASTQATNGYTRSPNGVIIQWGTVIIGSAGTNITLPVSFPTACTAVLASCTTNNLARASIVSNSTINVACNPSTPQTCYWMAFGY